MPSNTSATEGGRVRSEVAVGVAGPPAHSAPVAALFPGARGFCTFHAGRVWHPQTLSGGSGSLLLHSLLLLLLALWYFARLDRLSPSNLSHEWRGQSTGVWMEIN